MGSFWDMASTAVQPVQVTGLWDRFGIWRLQPYSRTASTAVQPVQQYSSTASTGNWVVGLYCNNNGSSLVCWIAMSSVGLWASKIKATEASKSPSVDLLAAGVQVLVYTRT